MKIIITLVSFLSISLSQTIDITSPKGGQSFEYNDDVEIVWSTSKYYSQKVTIYWGETLYKKDWKKIDEVNANEGSFWWYINEKEMMRSSGIIYIIIYGSYGSAGIRDIVKIKIAPVLRNKTLSKKTIKPNKKKSQIQKNAETYAYYQKLFAGKGSKYDVFITKTDNIRYGPGTSHNIAFKSYYGERYKYIDTVGNWYVIKTYSGNRIYFTYKTNGEIVPKGGAPVRNTGNPARASSSNGDSFLGWCILFVGTLILLY